MKNKFSIGQMSKLHNIPVKTLRYYDEIDLFKPIEVNPENGYRYYSIEQFKLLDIINYLKVLGVPLADIKKQTSNRDINELIDTLQEHKRITEQKIQELEMAKKKLEARIDEFKTAKYIEDINVPFIKTIPERKIIQLKETISSFFELELSLRKLKQQYHHLASIFIGKVGLTISENNFQRESFLEYSSIFLILEEVERSKLIEEIDFAILPQGTYACIFFRGGHSDAPAYFHVLNDFIKENDYKIKGDFIIRTIIDEFISKNQEEFLAEIQVLIE
ncbi:MerR family transcriptional regulator [Siminovitchia terrae]|uniref:MerR family transcriptional regulator n=1 Tax=Siminovitchia terrae TaxID=1914933 RepID=A0A429X2B0_SIMTE|nr:MerR family transcriptional regulator [Siminovitchia terrae]RST57547.1 MerR family transcriptional regulator [Siminovitchia terrae]GIN90458.1 MerR family transcriptional regulator [Siminovitchia terrae]GIN97067.1 MerR family transcriptional regulator [Siminovitchia terrae]